MYFVSSNDNKFREIKELIAGYAYTHFSLEHRKLKLKEIQSNSLEEVAKVKANDAYELIGDEVLVEDDGLFIESLNDFPGVYSSFVFNTLGNKGILDLLRNKKSRRATFKSIIAFQNGKTMRIFAGQIKGHISENIFKCGWGYDPIFIPDKIGIPFGQMDMSLKNKYSHRRLALQEFCAWYTKNNPDPKIKS
jgi:XTP/dITP diphosphohydrolase